MHSEEVSGVRRGENCTVLDKPRMICIAHSDGSAIQIDLKLSDIPALPTTPMPQTSCYNIQEVPTKPHMSHNITKSLNIQLSA